MYIKVLNNRPDLSSIKLKNFVKIKIDLAVLEHPVYTHPVVTLEAHAKTSRIRVRRGRLRTPSGVMR